MGSDDPRGTVAQMLGPLTDRLHTRTMPEQRPTMDAVPDKNKALDAVTLDADYDPLTKAQHAWRARTLEAWVSYLYWLWRDEEGRGARMDENFRRDTARLHDDIDCLARQRDALIESSKRLHVTIRTLSSMVPEEPPVEATDDDQASTS